MTYQNFEFTAYAESDFSGIGSSLGCGDHFTMPGAPSICIEVKDNDAFLSGDCYDNATDHYGQHASIIGANGDDLGNGGQIYAEKYYWVWGSDGKWYVLVEIEQEHSNDDYFAFYTGHGYSVPAEGTELYVHSSCNINGDWMAYNCLDAGEKVVKDMWVFDDDTCTYTTEAECWDLHNFKTVDGDQASGGELIKIAAHDGKISTDFGGDTGIYNLTICAQDECDGKSKLMVYVNGEFQETVKLDRQTDGWGSDNGGFSDFTLNGLEITKGDKVEIRAWADGGEWVRIDAIKFEQVKFEECDLEGAVKLDFESFAAGDILTDLDGITISATGGSGDAMIFDSQNPTGGDADLETQVAQLGNVLIVSEDGDSSDPDDVVGGTITFDFDNPATIFDLKFIDTEEGGTVTLTLEDGSTQTFDVPELVNGGVGQLVMNVENVVSMEVALDGSGAIDDLCYVPGEAPLGSLSGRYFCDVNRDDVDNGEPGVEGIVVYLLDANGNRTGDQTTTDSDGNYSFVNLVAGTYGVEFADENNVNVGKSLVAANDPDGNGDDTNDSDAIGDATSSKIENIVVVAGQDTPDNDAGVEDIPGSLSGRYFCDVNRDDVDNGEPGVEGIVVYLLDANGNRTGDQTTTDSDGNYSFANLLAGTYGVEFADENNVNVGKSLVAANDPDGNGDDTNDSDAIGDATSSKIENIVVVAGQDTPDNDAGVEDIPGSLSGRYFCDVNRDDVDNGEPGVEGIVVYLLDANGNRTGDQTTTDSDGNYSFANLLAGTYGVEFADENNVNVGKSLVAANDPDGNGDDTNDSDAIGDATSSKIENIVVVAGQDTPDNDAGVEDIPGSLSGRYFCDVNRDGLDNDGANGTASAGIAGVMVMLLDAGGNAAVDIDGNPVAAVMTDSNGNYSFGNLAAGLYSVKFTDAVSGKILTTQNVDGDLSDDIDSDAEDLGGGMSQIDGIEVVAGQNTPDNDAGVFPNEAPEVTGDTGKGCADEEITVDLSDNYSDADSASVSITMLGGLNIADGEMIELSGTADDGNLNGFDFTGLKVMRNGDEFVFDGEAAFADLDIGEEATATIEFKVEDSDGAATTASIDVTFCGDANSVASLCDSLPVGTIEYKIQASNIDFPVEDYAFNLQIVSSGDERFDGEIYANAYCLGFGIPISQDEVLADAPIVEGTMFCIEDAVVNGTFNSDQVSVYNGQNAADNLDLITWILNQEFEGNGYTGWEVQRAVWELTDSTDLAYLDGIDPGFGSDANVQDILLQASAFEGFEAGVGDIVGVIIDPGDAVRADQQPFIIGINYEDYDCLC